MGINEKLHELFTLIDNSPWTMHWKDNELVVSQQVIERSSVDANTLDEIKNLIGCEKPWIKSYNDPNTRYIEVKAEFDVEEFKKKLKESEKE